MFCRYNKASISKAFTLIELLVVISIIALLVSIIMPALNRAKDSAKRTVCATNLKTIGQGLFMYATNNNDKIPQTDYDMGAPGTPNKTYMMYLLKSNYADIAEPMDRIDETKGLGYLYGKKYIDTAKVFYCDGVPRSSLSWRYELFEGGGGYPWNTGALNHNNHYVRCSFSYLPQSRKQKMGLAIPGDYTPTQGIIRDGKEYFPVVAKSISELYGEYAIACGLLQNLSSVPHKMGKNASGVNVLFGDSSVRFSNNRDAFDEDLWDDSIGDGDHEYEFRKVYSLLK